MFDAPEIPPNDGHHRLWVERLGGNDVLPGPCILRLRTGHGRHLDHRCFPDGLPDRHIPNGTGIDAIARFDSHCRLPACFSFNPRMKRIVPCPRARVKGFCAAELSK
ncbi:hypothetical protein EJV44_00680 [Ancylobacter aquaticus]|nr:hypothetical protein EJV44_00680 [Ancylobacter aquaticus]